MWVFGMIGYLSLEVVVRLVGLAFVGVLFCLIKFLIMLYCRVLFSCGLG